MLTIPVRLAAGLCRLPLQRGSKSDCKERSDIRLWKRCRKRAGVSCYQPHACFLLLRQWLHRQAPQSVFSTRVSAPIPEIFQIQPANTKNMTFKNITFSAGTTRKTGRQERQTSAPEEPLLLTTFLLSIFTSLLKTILSRSLKARCLPYFACWDFKVLFSASHPRESRVNTNQFWKNSQAKTICDSTCCF